MESDFTLQSVSSNCSLSVQPTTPQGNVSTSSSVDVDENFISTMNMAAYRAVVISVALVGVLANGLTAYVVKHSKHTKHEKFNVLFLNQISLDMYSSMMLTIVTCLRLLNLRLVGSWGYWLCMIVLDEMLLWIGINGSTANLVVIAIVRYL